MSCTIISNNCAGGYLYMDLRLQYSSPTMWLQILPREFPKFCKYLKYYMDCELKEYKHISQNHMSQIVDLIGQEPYFPVGILDDVVILFQHYKTFEEAREKWNRRKERIDYRHLVYLFVMDKVYEDAAIQYKNLDLKNSILCVRNINLPVEHIRYLVPKGIDYLTINPYTRRRCFEGFADLKEYIRGIS